MSVVFPNMSDFQTLQMQDKIYNLLIDMDYWKM